MSVVDGKPLTQEDLAHRECLGEGCDHKAEFLDQRCHPGRGQRVRYDHARGALELVCRVCKKFVALVAVAAVAAVRGTCRVCGCTEDAACVGGCCWADESETLCSQCMS